MFDSINEINRLYWTIGLVLLVPLATVILVELELRQQRRNSQYKYVFRNIRTLLLPMFALWLALTRIAGYEETENLPRIIASLADISAIIVGLSIVNAILFSNVSENSWQARTPKLLVDIVRMVLVAIGCACVLSFVWGVDLGKAAAALGVGSLVIGFAVAEPLGNVFAGLMLLLERPIMVGDWIKVGDVTGKVIEINWRAVHLRAFQMELLVVPNSVLAKQSFSNYSRPLKIHCEILNLGFSYNDPPNKVRFILFDLIENTTGVLKDPPPLVRVKNYGDYTIDYAVIFYVEDFSKLAAVRDAFMTRIWYAAQREGLTIPFPIATRINIDADAEQLKARPPISQALQKFPLLKPLSEKQIREIESISLWKKYSQNEIVAGPGELLDGLYLVVSGRLRALEIRINGQETPVYEVNQGEIFGESVANSERRSSLKLIALEDMNCIIIPAEKLNDLILASPRFARELSQIIEARRMGKSSPNFNTFLSMSNL
jgi:small-conductance mechanosensitive channel